ncbi:alcohol dehydrogenase [Apiospora arundinis]
MAVTQDLPKLQRAIVANEKLDYSIRDDVPVPPLADDCVIIKTEAIGLNPVDTKMVGPFVAAGASYGIDCSGYLVAMGKDVAATGRLKLGDRVCGSADGMEGLRPQSGAFAEYASMNGGMVLKMPDDMSFETGAGMGLRIATAAMALFHSMGISPKLLEKPATGDEVFDVLVYAAQVLRSTCHHDLFPRNFDMVKGYGADVVFDYNSPTCGADIRAFCGNALDYALDCITEESTMKICYQAIGRLGGKYCGLEPYPVDYASNRRAVEPDWILATWMRGLPISWPEPFGNAGKPECREFAANFFPSSTLSSLPVRSSPTRHGRSPTASKA